MLQARSKNLISAVLSNLAENIARTHDPLGFKSVYWTGWADDLNLRRGGDTILFTARIYQMLPYILQTTKMVEQAKPFLSRKGLSGLINLGNRLAGETVVRIKASGEKKIRAKGEQTLKGILAALSVIETPVNYMYEKEPYSGVLLHDLGLEELIAPHIEMVNSLFKEQGIKRVVCVDPHTTYMLKEVFPHYIKEYDLEVKHYLELLVDRLDDLAENAKEPAEKNFVLHDSCLLARNLTLIEQTRQVADALGLSLEEPPNNKQNTACCGGPIEYAFNELSEQVSGIRIKELAAVSKNILVFCPICLINLAKYEKELGVKVWDLGEILYSAFDQKLAKLKMS